MNWPAFAKKLILADGHISDWKAHLIQQAVSEDRVVDLQELEFLADLKRDAVSVHRSFDEFLLRVLKKYLLAAGDITDEQALWLRGLIFADNQTVRLEVGFVEDIRHQARSYGQEFENLHRDCTVLQRNQLSD